MQTMIEEQKRRIAAKINAHGFDANREVGDLPFFVGLKEWKERHGDVVPSADNQTNNRSLTASL